RAADELATIVVNQVSGQYVDTKIKNLKTNIAADKAELDNINGRLSSLQDQIRGGSISATDKLILGNLIGLAIHAQRQVTPAQTTTQPPLALAQSVERTRVLPRARASKATARSRRNSILVGALIGLVIGILAALLWEPAARVVRRASV